MLRSWTDCRIGFIGDMDSWGIDTFFSICTTTSEHTPVIAENIFVWPNFIDGTIYKDYHLVKKNPVLFTGGATHLYPWRRKIFKILSAYYPSFDIPHFGYGNKARAVTYGEQYARAINASWFVPTCGTVAKEVVRKHFEIPGS